MKQLFPHIAPKPLRLAGVFIVLLSFLTMQFAGSWHVHGGRIVAEKNGAQHSISSGQDCPLCAAHLVGPAEIAPLHSVGFILPKLFLPVIQETSLLASAITFHSGRAPPFAA